MASCERIAPLLQAYVDGELASWERLTVEHHVRDCVLCAEELREVTSCSASLFESLAACRLSPGFRDRVMKHLPKRIPAVLGINRADGSHVAAPLDRLSRWSLAGAVVVLLLALGIIVYNYPARIVPPVQIGMVTGAEDSVEIEHAYEGNVREAVVRDLVFKGDRFETNNDAKLILSLEGPTEIKPNGNTELLVDNERFIRLVRGEIWGHVGGQSRVFKVQTPHGDVTVTGTEFNVKIEPKETSVAVVTGKVLLATEKGFTEVSAGQTCTAEPHLAPRDVREVAVADIGKWARTLVPQTVDSRYSMADEHEGQVGVLYRFRPSERRRVVNVLIRRDAYGTEPLALPAGTFTVKLYNDRMEELASRTLPLLEFTGTNANGRILVDFSRDNFIVDRRPFYVLLAPNVDVLKSLPVRTDVDVIKYTGEEVTYY